MSTQRTTKRSATRQQIVELIASLDAGDAIPSERVLSAELGVSRVTVRAALDELSRDGQIVRRGGSGTYVQEQKIAQELTMTSFTEDMLRRGMVPSSRTLSVTTVLAGARLGRCLHVSPSERVFVVKRLRLADGETMAVETLHVPSGLAPGLASDDLSGSYYELLRKRYNIAVVAGTQTIEPTVTSEEESTALGVPLHSPAFLFERTTRDELDRTVEFVRSVYRGDRYQIVMSLSL